MKIIEVENLVKKYHKSTQNAVDNVSFFVNAGEFFAFLGPNGAGKTTTISVLTTTLSKTSGSVKIAGFDLEKESSKVRANIGVIFQNPSLDLNLTAEENLRFHAVLYGLYSFNPLFSLMPEEYKKRVYELAEVLDLKKDIFKPIRSFSGGMKRKLEIIRTLMHKPKVLFLDEPTSGLDPLSRKNLWHYLKEVREKENTTIFLTTHYLDEAEGADNVCIINNGKIVMNGTPEAVKEKMLDEYLMIDSANREDLTEELKRLNIDFVEDGFVKVNLKNLNVQELIKKINTHLTTLKIVKPTLEEAYVQIIDHKGEAQ